MRILQNLSIRRKQMLIIMLTSGLVLLLASVAFVVYDAIAFRGELVGNTSTMAEIIGNNCTAALDFNDSDEASQTLSALRDEPNVVVAAAYDRAGNLFAAYRRDRGAVVYIPPTAPHAGHEFADDQLHLTRPIAQGDEIVGHLLIVSDLNELSDRLQRYITTVSVVFMLSLLVAFTLSDRLQRLISGPILHLAQVARTVAQEKNYSLRATKRDNDELGQLIEGFNEMLRQIQERDAALQTARDNLERRVEERTTALRQEILERQRSEKALQESHQRFEIVTRTTSDVIWDWNLIRNTIWWNENLQTVFGYSLAEFGESAESWTSRIHPDDEPVVRSGIQAAIDGGEQIWSSEYRFRRRDGTYASVFDRGQILRDENGRPVRMIGAMQDISERKQAEVAAVAFGKLGRDLSRAASREEAARIISEISDDLFGWDAFSIQVYSAKDDTLDSVFEVDTMDGRRIRSKGRAPRKPTALHRRIFSAGAELVLRKAESFLPDALPFGDAARPSASIMYVPIRAGGEIVGIVSIHSYTPEAYSRQHLATLQTLADHCGGALQRIRAHEAQREFESQFRLVWETSVDGMRLADRDGKVLMVNQAYCRMVDKAKAEIEGNSLATIHCPENAAVVLANHRQRVDAAVEQSRLETPATLWNGRKVWFEMSNSRLQLPGHPPLLLSVFRDITQRKEAEAELERTHRQLLETSRAAGMAEVATSVLHNVGNVLNSVNTSASVVTDRLRQCKADGVSRVAELLEQNRHDVPGFFALPGRTDQVINFLRTLTQSLMAEQKHALAEMAELTKNVEHIKEIVTMQQGYARVAGVTETVGVVDLIEDALRMNGGELLRHHINLVRNYAPQLPDITVDKHKVLQVLVNLIRNAKHACEESDRPDKQLTVRVLHEDDTVRITIADNGVGIIPENLTRIFTHGFTTRKDGHGFGLHSGALAAREMGGALSVHSDGAGKGARFTLELPIRPEVRKKSPEMPTQPTPFRSVAIATARS